MKHFTVLVPTRNRADTLYWTVKSCLSQDYERMTLLVSNNSSEDNTEEVLASFNDPRLKVIKTPAPTSISGNLEFALDQILEEDTFVTYIGDDDGLIPGGLAHANTVLKEYPDTEAITWKTSQYNWPDCLVPEWRNMLTLSTSDHVQRLDSAAMLAKLAEYRVYYFDLPGPISSFVSTKTLRECKRRSGNLMISRFPDVGSAVHVACTIPSYVFTHRSVTLFGSSSKSNGLAFSQQKKELISLFQNESTIREHPDLVMAPNAFYYVTESLFQAHDRGILPQNVSINLSKALQLMMIRNPADPDAVHEQICQAAASTASRHGVPFDREVAIKANEEELVQNPPFTDPIVTEHASALFHQCDPRLISNIHGATCLAGELLAMLKNGLLVSQAEHIQSTGALSACLKDKKLELSKAKERGKKLEKKLAEAKAPRKGGLLKRIRDQLRGKKSFR